MQDKISQLGAKEKNMDITESEAKVKNTKSDLRGSTSRIDPQYYVQ